MIVAQARGVRFIYDEDRQGMRPILSDSDRAQDALWDVVTALGFAAEIAYLTALAQKKRKLLTKLKHRQPKARGGRP